WNDSICRPPRGPLSTSTTTSRTSTRSSRESSGSKRSSPDVRDVRPVSGADPGPLQTSEEQGSTSGRNPEREGLEPALRRRGDPSFEPRRFSTCRGGPLRRARLRDQPGERIDPHDDVERTCHGRGRSVEPRRTAEETGSSLERRPSEMCPSFPPRAEARPGRQEDRPGLRPEGYRATLCVPANISSDRRRMLEAHGAELILTPASDGTDGAQKAAKDLVFNDPEKYWYLDQYDNEANWRAHYTSTGPEIWRQTRQTITHFVSCLGTTGTF